MKRRNAYNQFKNDAFTSVKRFLLSLKKERMKRGPDFPASYTFCMHGYCTYRTLIIYRHFKDFYRLLKFKMTLQPYEFIF